MTNKSSSDDVTLALGELEKLSTIGNTKDNPTNEANQTKLTDGELSSLSSSLGTVAKLLKENTMTNIVIFDVGFTFTYYTLIYLYVPERVSKVSMQLSMCLVGPI